MQSLMLISYEFLGSMTGFASVFVSYDFLSLQLFCLNKLSIGHGGGTRHGVIPIGPAFAA
jgi:hypothetical protein